MVIARTGFARNSPSSIDTQPFKVYEKKLLSLGLCDDRMKSDNICKTIERNAPSADFKIMARSLYG